MDDEKAFLRADAPTMSVEILRLLVSIAAERGWRLGSLDIKAAYLQAAGFDREIFVRPPRKRPIPITYGSCGSQPTDWSKVGGSGF
jgi:Reverse transcriptase (RNA-dependent DNA polymerase)